jgi:hypothetical protein
MKLSTPKARPSLAGVQSISCFLYDVSVSHLGHSWTVSERLICPLNKVNVSCRYVDSGTLLNSTFCFSPFWILRFLWSWCLLFLPGSCGANSRLIAFTTRHEKGNSLVVMT